MIKRGQRVFLDYASTTPIDGRVLKVLKKNLKKNWFNPSALYTEGISVSNLLEDSRERVAKIVGTKSGEVTFTGSGTEADNLAILGILEGIRKDETELFKYFQNNKPHIIVSEIEHPAIMEVCKDIEEKELAEITYLPVLSNGKIDTSAIKKYIRPETILISVILVNNEIGVIQSLRDISKVVKRYKNEMGRRFDEPPYVHTDASQAPCFLDIHMDRLGAHMMTLDSSKVYGPKGVGCLIKKSYIPMSSIMYGGGQENRLRPGTENTPLITGFVKALEIAEEEREKTVEKVSNLQQYFIQQLGVKVPEAKVNGSMKDRVVNNINICVPGLNSEFAVIQLDEKGVTCSAMTACKSVSEEARSYVIDAINDDCGASSLRFTLGKHSKKKDIDIALDRLREVIDLQR